MGRRLLALGGIAVGVGLGILIASASGFTDLSWLKDRLLKNPIAVGKKAPDFELPSLNHGDVQLSTYQDRLVILNFWATWCEPCKAEMPHFQEVHDDNPETITVASVNLAEQIDLVEQFAQEFSIQFPILLDSDGHAARLYQVNGVPTTFIIDGSGRIAVHHIGYLSEEKLDDYLRENR